MKNFAISILIKNDNSMNGDTDFNGVSDSNVFCVGLDLSGV